MTSTLFTPYQLGPITLRNRTIRSAAFENMAYHNMPSEDLYNYHLSVAKGGIGMTTVAYCAVNRSGVSFDGQLYIHEEAKVGLKRLTDAIHATGAKVSIQLGHCGNMTHFYTCKCLPVGASNGFNLYSPTIHRALTIPEIHQTVKDFGTAVDFCRECGFDCVEIHAGHGYLISQFLSPYTNHRTDEYGGSLENRMRFLNEVLDEVMTHAKDDMAVIVKTNMYDGFDRGLQIPDCMTIAKDIEAHGVHALVLTAGFVSKAPFTVMGGAMPIKTLAHYMNPWTFWWLRLALRFVGHKMIPTVPFKELYFLDTAKQFRQVLKLPLIYVGGIMSRANCEEALNSGFDCVQIAHALVKEPDFVNKMLADEHYHSLCKRSNYCVARMYSKEMCCHECLSKTETLPKSLMKEIRGYEKQWYD